MASPSRFSRVGLSGRLGNTNLSDSFIQIWTFPILGIPDGGVLDSGVEVPEFFLPVHGFLNVFSPETIGSASTVNIGVSSATSGSIAGNCDGGTLGFQIGTQAALAAHNTPGQTLTYQFGAADYGDLDAEAIVFGIGSE